MSKDKEDEANIAKHYNADINVSQGYIGSAGIDEEAIQAQAIYKRALYLTGSSNLEITNDTGQKAHAKDNKLPTATYLSHGSRVVVEIPPGSGDQLINWFTSGDKNKSGLSKKQTKEAAIQTDKTYIYNRSAATHDINIHKNKAGDYELTEKKGFFIGAGDYVKDKLFRQKGKHYGIDLGLKKPSENIEPGQNLHDGEHGHLYMHYTPPTQDKPGSLMYGIENASPQSSKHSKVGKAAAASASGGEKFPKLQKLIQKNEAANDKNPIIPKKYNGMYAKLDTSNLEKITSTDINKYHKNLADAIPAENSTHFNLSVANAASRDIMQPKKGPQDATNKLNKASEKAAGLIINLNKQETMHKTNVNKNFPKLKDKTKNLFRG